MFLWRAVFNAMVALQVFHSLTPAAIDRPFFAQANPLKQAVPSDFGKL
jgi:hypothetical protein